MTALQGLNKKAEAAMKRSDFNSILTEADAFFRKHGVSLPPFAHLSPDALKAYDHALTPNGVWAGM